MGFHISNEPWINNNCVLTQTYGTMLSRGFPWFCSAILFLLLFFNHAALADELISGFDDGDFGERIEFNRNFGLDVNSEEAPEISDDSTFIFSGNGALKAQSDADFSEGHVVGSVFDFVPPANVAGTYNSVSYWVRSENDHSTEGVTAFIQLIMTNGSIWEQFIQLR